MVDDSIVRGTTSAQIVEMAREVGANKVYFASAAPPVRYQNVYGIDMPMIKEFIANGKNIDEICQTIGADKLFYQTLEDLIEVTSIKGEQSWDTNCFDGKYITGDVTDEYLMSLELARNDDAKSTMTSLVLLLSCIMTNEVSSCKMFGILRFGELGLKSKVVKTISKRSLQ